MSDAAEMKFSEIRGKGVLSQDGRELGVVEDLRFDHEQWRIDALIVKLDRELLEQFGMKKPMFGTTTIEVETGLISGVGDKVILHESLDDISAGYRGQDSSEG